MSIHNRFRNYNKYILDKNDASFLNISKALLRNYTFFLKKDA